MVVNYTGTACDLPISEVELYHKLIYVLSSIVLALSGIGLNCYILHLIRTHMTLQTYANGFVACLCIADVIAILSLVGLAVVTHIVKQNVLQIIFERIHYISFDVTVMMIAVIAIDRFASLKYSLNYSSRMTGSKVFAVIVTCWLYALLLYLMPYAFHFVPRAFFHICQLDSSGTESIILSVGMLYLPCFIGIVMCYFKIYRIARYHTRAITATDRSVFYNYPNHRIQRSMKYVKTLLEVLGTFLILTLPLKICMIFLLEGRIHFYLLIIASVNCVVSPWIYAYNRSEFRSAIRPPTAIRDDALRHGEAIADVLSTIFGKGDQDNASSKTKDDNENDEQEKNIGNDNLSWKGFSKRTSRVSVTLHDDKREMQLQIEDVDCNTSRSSLQLSVEHFGQNSHTFRITQKCGNEIDNREIQTKKSEQCITTLSDIVKDDNLEILSISDL